MLAEVGASGSSGRGGNGRGAGGKGHTASQTARRRGSDVVMTLAEIPLMFLACCWHRLWST